MPGTVASLVFISLFPKTKFTELSETWCHKYTLITKAAPWHRIYSHGNVDTVVSFLVVFFFFAWQRPVSTFTPWPISVLWGKMRRGEKVLLRCWGSSMDNQASRLTPITCSLIKQRAGVMGLSAPRRLWLEGANTPQQLEALMKAYYNSKCTELIYYSLMRTACRNYKKKG